MIVIVKTLIDHFVIYQLKDVFPAYKIPSAVAMMPATPFASTRQVPCSDFRQTTERLRYLARRLGELTETFLGLRVWNT